MPLKEFHPYPYANVCAFEQCILHITGPSISQVSEETDMQRRCTLYSYVLLNVSYFVKPFGIEEIVLNKATSEMIKQ